MKFHKVKVAQGGKGREREKHCNSIFALTLIIFLNTSYFSLRNMTFIIEVQQFQITNSNLHMGIKYLPNMF